VTAPLAAVLVVARPPSDQGRALAELVDVAGGEELGVPEAVSGLALCRWAGMTCRVYVDRLPDHDVLVLLLPRSEVLALTDVEPGDNPLVEAFTAAVGRVRPEAAFVAVHPDQAEPDRIRAAVELVELRDADALADERFGLLYVDAVIAQWWTPHELRDGREELPVASGRLVFAGRGSSRWF
jgi:hypothetical protein